MSTFKAADPEHQALLDAADAAYMLAAPEHRPDASKEDVFNALLKAWDYMLSSGAAQEFNPWQEV